MAASKGKIVSSVIGYGALSWGLIQVLSTIIPAFSLPQFYLTWTIIFVAVAFPFYLVLIWRQPGFLGFLSLPGDKAVMVPVPADGINRILISKFKVLRDGTSTDFLAVSLPEAIANALIGIKKLSVQLDTTGIAHYSAEQLAELASTRKLNAILTGSILTVENQVRISASLIEQPTNAVIWTESTQSLIGDLFELQDLISQRIIKALQLKLTDEERQGIEKKNTKSADAYELFLKANELSIHVDQWEAAKDMYIQCLEKDPTFSSAMARLARCYRVLGKYTLSDTESVRNLAFSEAYIIQAMRLDPQSDMAIGLYAQLLVDEGKPIEALKLLLRRIKDSNSNANLYASLVHVLRFCGLLNESLEADKIAKSINPSMVTSVGQTYWMKGDYETARDLKKGDIGYLEGVALAALNQFDEAIAQLQVKEAKLENNQVRSYLKSLRFALMGNKEESVRNLEIAITPAIDGEALYYFMRTYAFLGETEKAFEGISKAVDKGFYQKTVFESDPWLVPLKRNPGFNTLMEKAGMLTVEARAALQSTDSTDENILRLRRQDKAPVK